MERTTRGEPDFVFGHLMLTLRLAIGLTQANLADLLRVSRHAVGEWEGGQSYPKTNHLKNFIVLCLQQHAFEAGQEVEDIRVLWKAAHQKVLLDEQWLQNLFIQPVSPVIPPQEPIGLHNNAKIVTLPVVSSKPKVDWGDAIDVPNFYGRKMELAQLSRWIVEEHCRVVSVLGLGGIGKSALTVTLIRQLVPDFEIVIWRSVRDAPDCKSLIDGCLQVLAPEMLNENSDSLERRLNLLLKNLQTRRVLLVIDNLETLMEEGQNPGYMRSGYESYGRLLNRVAETAHKSCLLLTSREKPIDLIALEGSRSTVRILRLTPLEEEACERLLLDKDVRGTSAEKAQLSITFNGNPLALKIVARTIVDLFDGEIARFLEQGEAIFGGVRKLLDQQFARLSTMEQTVLIWLAILREPVPFDRLLAGLVRPLPGVKLLETLEALYRRSLIERGEKPGSFTLQSVVLEYLTTRLVEEAADELIQGNLNRLVQHCLVHAQAREYVRQTQKRVIIQPLLALLKNQHNNTDRVENYLKQTLEQVRQMPQNQQGYAGGNILNLLVEAGSNLVSCDFSGLTLWQAYLAEVELRNINLSGCDLRWSVFKENFSALYYITYSPDGKYLAGGSQVGDIKLWQFSEGSAGAGLSLHKEYRGHQNIVTSIAYSPDGKLMASGSFDQTVRLWDCVSGENLAVFEGHTNCVNSVAFSSDGKLVASGSMDYTVRLWVVATGKALATLTGHTHQVYSVAFSPQDQLLASSGYDGTVRLWDTNPWDGGYQPGAILSGHQGLVSSVAFSPDGQTLYSCSADSTIRVWSVANREQLQILQGHPGMEPLLAVSPDGVFLASTGQDQVIRLWQLEQGNIKLHRILAVHNGTASSLSFSPDSATLVSNVYGSGIRFWSVQSGEELTTVQVHPNSLLHASLSSDGSYLASTMANKRVLLWQLPDQYSPVEQEFTPSFELKGHKNEVYTLAFNQQGTQLATGSFDSTINLWNITHLGESNQGKIIHTLTGHTDNIYSVAFHPEGNLLASGSGDGTIKLWSTSDGKLIKTLVEHRGIVRKVIFNPNGRFLASGGKDGTVRLWDSHNGQLLNSFSTDEVGVLNLAYHWDGQLLACAKSDGTLQVWQFTGDSLQPQLLHSLKGHKAPILSIVFNPAAHNLPTLLSGGNDKTMRLWDIQRGHELALFEHETNVQSVAFMPDGKCAISAPTYGLIKLWNIEQGKIVANYRDFLPYEKLNIQGVTGLTVAQRATLLSMGAVES